jgi:hypothetical protein
MKVQWLNHAASKGLSVTARPMRYMSLRERAALFTEVAEKRTHTYPYEMPKPEPSTVASASSILSCSTSASL